MARDGNGNYTKAEADFVGGSVINATAMNSNFDDIAVALTNSIAKNGETKVTGDIDFNSNKAVNVKDATASADATNLKVIQNRVGVHGTSSGTNTITLTLSPAISGYVAGQEFTFKAGGTNTKATTLNINAKGAKGVLTQQGLALTAGSIVKDKFYKVRYDGTSFILLDGIANELFGTVKPTALAPTDLLTIKSGSDYYNVPASQVVMNSDSAFSAYVGTTLSDVTGDNTTYSVVFNTENSDIGSDYDNTTGVFTAPVDGLYQFNVSLAIGDLTTSHTFGNINASKTGGATFFGTGNLGAMRATSTSPDSLIITGSELVKMDAGDKASIKLRVGGGTKVVDISGGVFSTFSGHLVRSL
jgi:hypothetical protein